MQHLQNVVVLRFSREGGGVNLKKAFEGKHSLTICWECIQLSSVENSQF